MCALDSMAHYIHINTVCIDHKMCVVIFSKTFVSNICHSKKNSVRYHYK